MAKYISIRGWLECQEHNIKKLKEIVDSYTIGFKEKSMEQDKRELYQKGWHFPNEVVNWTAYVFYGADIRESDLEFIELQINEMAKTDTDIEGCFFIDDDEYQISHYWKIDKGTIIKKQRME